MTEEQFQILRDEKLRSIAQKMDDAQNALDEAAVEYDKWLGMTLDEFLLTWINSPNLIDA